MLQANIDLNGSTILVTGAAGFIGSNLVRNLLRAYQGIHIVGIDNMNPYYDVSLKEYRLQQITQQLSTPSPSISSSPSVCPTVFPSGSSSSSPVSSSSSSPSVPSSPSSPSGSSSPSSISNFHFSIFNSSSPSVCPTVFPSGSSSSEHPFTFIQGSIADKALLDSLFRQYQFDVVVNLAAQAGVRYSITNPDAYIESNIIGFYNILEACRHHPVRHLVYASSSSVYGGNTKIPFSTDDKVDTPVSLYAATKKSDELLAHAYSKLYGIPSTGLRFFTVYGPAGRPDMAYFGFTNKLVKGETIQIFNYGHCRRDFTYVDDIVEGIVRVLQHSPVPSGEGRGEAVPYAIYNIGGGQPENLLDFVTILQEELLRAGVLPADYDFEAHKQLVPMQPGDVPVTYADTTALERDFGFTPKITLREGLRHFAEWYKSYYG